jgi:hypothetical protein
MPAIVSLAAVPFARAQVPAPLASAIETVVWLVPDVEAVAEQLLNPDVKPIVGVLGTTKLELNTTVTFAPAARAPLVLAVKPTVHVLTVPLVCGDPLNVTALTVPPAGLMTTPDAGDAGCVSALVATLKFPAA